MGMLLRALALLEDQAMAIVRGGAGMERQAEGRTALFHICWLFMDADGAAMRVGYLEGPGGAQVAALLRPGGTWAAPVYSTVRSIAYAFWLFPLTSGDAGGRSLRSYGPLCVSAPWSGSPRPSRGTVLHRAEWLLGSGQRSY